MNHQMKDSGRQTPSPGRRNAPFIWPLGKSSTTPDEMNTSYGPRIDADLWDFHDGIDLPAAVGTPVHAMAEGMVHRAGPADKTGPGQGFGSTHIILKVVDPTDDEEDLFLVYLHLDRIAQGLMPGVHVSQGDVIGTVGQEDATYPHLHFEFRKGGPQERRSVHPLRYLPYPNTKNFRNLRLDRCNFYHKDGDKRMVRLRFDVADRREGDVQGVAVELKRTGGAPRRFHVDFDDRNTIVSDKGDEHAFKHDIAVEGYQKSNLKGDGLQDLHYGVVIQDISPEYESVSLQVLNVKNEKPKNAEFILPKLGTGKKPINRRVGFEESEAFPPPGWGLRVLSGNICRLDEAAKITGSRGLLCQDLQSAQGTLIRSGLRFHLPTGSARVLPMSWRLLADIRPAELQMDEGHVIHPLAFVSDDTVVAAACLRKIGGDQFVAGVLIRAADGLFRERIDVNEGTIFTNAPITWELELQRLGTRQTTAVVRLNKNVIARINGATTNVEPDAACVGISHRHSERQITLHIDRLRLTEEPRNTGE